MSSPHSLIRVVEMVVKFDMKLQIVKGSIKCTIPKPIVKALDLEPQQVVHVYLSEDNKVVIEPAQ